MIRLTWLRDAPRPRTDVGVENASQPPRPRQMTEPSIDEVVQRAGGKFMVVTLAARRARALKEYFNGHTLPNEVPPQVQIGSSHPLSIALEEVASGRITAGAVSRAEFEEYRRALEQARLAAFTSMPEPKAIDPGSPGDIQV